MSPILRIIVKYSVIQLVLLLIALYLFDLSLLNIPEFIPGTPLKPSGLIFTGIILTIYILSQKELLKQNPQFGIYELTLYSTIIGSLAELEYQSIRQTCLPYDRLAHFGSGMITIIITTIVTCFLIAFQLKTKRTWWLIGFILIVGVILKIITAFLPNLVAQ